jgi:hypothetical protein
MHLSKTCVKLLGKDWKWECDWVVQGKDVLREHQPDTADGKKAGMIFKPIKNNQPLSVDVDGTYDKDGWQYSTDFQSTFNGNQKVGDLVRRRKWIRIQYKEPKALALPTPEKTKMKQIKPQETKS